MAGSPRGDKPPAGRRQEDKGSSAVFFQGPESHGLWRKIIICCWLWGRELCVGGGGGGLLVAFGRKWASRMLPQERGGTAGLLRRWFSCSEWENLNP